MSAFLGFVAGAGKGIAQAGDMMMKDAYEQKRMQRLEEAELRREQRASVAEEARFQRGLLTEWGDTDISGGTRAAQKRMEFESVYGAGADPGRGSKVIDQEMDYSLWNRKQEAEVGYHGQKARNSVAAAGTWELTNHPELGMVEVNTQTGQTRPLPPGAGSPHAKSEDGVGGLKDSDMRAIYDRELRNRLQEVLPEGDMAQGAVINNAGGWQPWAKKYLEALQVPHYLEWREQVFGIPNPDSRRAQPAQQPTDGPWRSRLTDNVRSAIQPSGGGLLGSGGQPNPEGLPEPKSREEVLALPSGTRFVTPDGRIGVRP